MGTELPVLAYSTHVINNSINQKLAPGQQK